MGLKDTLLELLAGLGRKPEEDQPSSGPADAPDLNTDETERREVPLRARAEQYIVVPRGEPLAPPHNDSLRVVRRDVADLQREKERLCGAILTQIVSDSPYAALLQDEQKRKTAKEIFARASPDEFVSSLSDMLPYVAPASLQYLIDRVGEEVIQRMQTAIQLETRLLNNVADDIPKQALRNKVEYTGMQLAFYSAVEQRAVGLSMREVDHRQRQSIVYGCRTRYVRLLDREERLDIEKGYSGLVMIEPYAVNWKLTQEIQVIQREKAQGEALLKS